MARAYADLWRQLGITHELTINAGLHSRPIRDEEVHQMMRRFIRKATCKLRDVPRRSSMDINPRDPNVLMVAGFVEPRTFAGDLQPHWHGGVALRNNEEQACRDLLWKHVGTDAENPLKPFEPSRTTHPLLRLPFSKPTFHFQKLTTVPRFIRYANKQVINADFPFFTTLDYLS